MTEAADLAGKFWDMGNYIAGFAAVQMVASLIAMATQRQLSEWVDRNRLIVGLIMIAFSLVIYVGGVWGCFLAEAYVRGSVARGSLLAAMYRTVWIVGFTALGVGSVYLDQLRRVNAVK